MNPFVTIKIERPVADSAGEPFEVRVFSERRDTGFDEKGCEWPLGLCEQAEAAQKFEALKEHFDEHGRWLGCDEPDDFETEHCSAMGGQITKRRADAAADAYFGSRSR